MELDERQTDVVINARNDQEVIVRKKSISIKAPFSAVGQLSNANIKRKESIMDIFDLLAKVSKGAVGAFRELKYHRDEENNVTKYDTSELSKTHKESFSRQLKELRDVGLIRSVSGEMKGLKPNVVYRYGRNTHIINPELLRCFYHDEAALLWEQCGKKSKGES